MSKEIIRLKGRCGCGWVNRGENTINIPQGSIHKASATIRCEDCGKKCKIKGSAKGK